jgi:NIMA (never in mitosis gene a)-related kinase
MSRLNQKEKENSLNEVRILASVNSQNVISYKDAFYDLETNCLCIVMEYADDGDLETKIASNEIYKQNYFSEIEIWKIFCGIAHGLKALHDKKVMHRDLKCANIFMNKQGEIKLGDMNVSKVIKMGLVNTQTGTPYYASPEVWKDLPYDYKSDIWSLGCILYEMCTGKPPFRGSNMEQVYNKVIKGAYEPINNSFSNDLKFMVSCLMQTNPKNRPSIDEVINIINSQEGAKKPNLLLEKFNEKNAKGNFNRDSFESQMLNTIKLPNDVKEINNVMPKSKYSVIVKVRNIKSSFVNRNSSSNSNNNNYSKNKNQEFFDADILYDNCVNSESISPLKRDASYNRKIKNNYEEANNNDYYFNENEKANFYENFEDMVSNHLEDNKGKNRDNDQDEYNFDNIGVKNAEEYEANFQEADSEIDLEKFITNKKENKTATILYLNNIRDNNKKYENISYNYNNASGKKIKNTIETEIENYDYGYSETLNLNSIENTNLYEHPNLIDKILNTNNSEEKSLIPSYNNLHTNSANSENNNNIFVSKNSSINTNGKNITKIINEILEDSENNIYEKDLIKFNTNNENNKNLINNQVELINPTNSGNNRAVSANNNKNKTIKNKEKRKPIMLHNKNNSNLNGNFNNTNIKNGINLNLNNHKKTASKANDEIKLLNNSNNIPIISNPSEKTNKNQHNQINNNIKNNYEYHSENVNNYKQLEIPLIRNGNSIKI